MPCLTNSEI